MSKKPATKDDVRKMTDEEVGVELSRLRNHLYSLRTQQVTSKVEDTTAFVNTRRSIARLLTERNVRRHKKAGGRPAAKAASTPAPTTPAKPVGKKSSKKPATRVSARRQAKSK
jgi:ribosomal protein L29